MRAGRLRHVMSFTSPTVTGQNSTGEDIVINTLVGTFPCLIEPMVGLELEKAMQKWAEAKYKISLRDQPGITFTRTMTGTWGTRTLDIRDVESPGDFLRPEIVMYARDYDG